MVSINFVLLVEENTVREVGSFSLKLYLPSLVHKQTSSYFDEDLIYHVHLLRAIYRYTQVVDGAFLPKRTNYSQCAKGPLQFVSRFWK